MNETRGCERVLARLDEYLDHGLPPLEEARDAGHLEVCGTCSAELERRGARLRELRAAMAPDGEELRALLQDLRSALDSGGAGQAPRRRGRLLRLRSQAFLPVLTAAAAVLVLVALELTGVAPRLSELSPELPDWHLRLPSGDVFGLGGGE